LPLSYFFDDTNVVPSVKDGLDSDCAICLAHLSQNDEAGHICAIDIVSNEPSSNVNSPISCGHKFHQNCINAWIKNVKKCPLCKGLVKK
jgi:hypothetical protein